MSFEALEKKVLAKLKKSDFSESDLIKEINNNMQKELNACPVPFNSDMKWTAELFIPLMVEKNIITIDGEKVTLV